MTLVKGELLSVYSELEDGWAYEGGHFAVGFWHLGFHQGQFGQLHEGQLRFHQGHVGQLWLGSCGFIKGMFAGPKPSQWPLTGAWIT